MFFWIDLKWPTEPFVYDLFEGYLLELGGFDVRNEKLENLGNEIQFIIWIVALSKVRMNCASPLTSIAYVLFPRAKILFTD